MLQDSRITVNSSHLVWRLKRGIGASYGRLIFVTRTAQMTQ